MRKLLRLLVSSGIALLMASAAQAADKAKVCFVYNGPVGDNGWTYRHDVARKEIANEMGQKIETTFIQSISPGADAERVIERYARQGCEMIFATTFGFMEPTLKMAKKFPDVKFEHATGFKPAENVTTYDVRYYEAFYVQGKIAASVSKSNSAGYIASFPIPVSIASINAFMLGAQSINPDFQLKIVWVNSWYDPVREADAAKVLISQGVDVIVPQTDSSAPVEVAEESGTFAFGMSSNKLDYGPNAHLTTLELNWAPYYKRRVQALLDGTWKSESSYDGFAEGTLRLAGLANMPEATKKLALEAVDEISSGTLHPFQGPVYNQQGELVVKEGEVLPVGEILGMNWYVKGISDEMPQ